MTTEKAKKQKESFKDQVIVDPETGDAPEADSYEQWAHGEDAESLGSNTVMDWNPDDYN